MKKEQGKISFPLLLMNVRDTYFFRSQARYNFVVITIVVTRYP